VLELARWVKSIPICCYRRQLSACLQTCWRCACRWVVKVYRYIYVYMLFVDLLFRLVLACVLLLALFFYCCKLVVPSTSNYSSPYSYVHWHRGVKCMHDCRIQATLRSVL
jgi:hypothetical protein